MDIRNFKAGFFKNHGSFKSFTPEKINIEWLIAEPELNDLLSTANRLIGALDSFSDLIPNIELFISMHVAEEATKSSKIEGTQTKIEEAFISEDEVNPERKDDWTEVRNYIDSLNYSIELLDKIPLSTRLICEAHKVLLRGVRGEHKLPGEFRRSQNWIGGASINDASFIPPSQDELSELMSDLEKFIHNDSIKVPHLIRIAIIHYQFETIHPFLDGNGRVGRLLITLYMIEKGIMRKPLLYLSSFFEKNRFIYYDKLMLTRLNNDLSGWIRFFLVGIIEIAEKAIVVFKSILRLKDGIEKNTLPQLGQRFNNGKLLLDELFLTPITSVRKVRLLLNTSHQTANKLIKDFEELGILKEITGFKRNRYFAFKDYLGLFKEP